MHGEIILILVAAAAALVGLGVWNYRRFVPKPVPPSGTPNEVEVRSCRIPAAGNSLYAELLLPKDGKKAHPTVICSHGLNGSYRYFRDSVGMSLAMSGYAVVCFDFYAGSVHSKSGGDTKKMSVFSERDQLCDVIDFVREQPFCDPNHLFLWGESQGGFVTALAAAQKPDVIRAAVLFYPAFCIPHDMRKRYGTIENVPETDRRMGIPLGRAYYEGMFDFDGYAEAAKYCGPVLIVHGDADRVVDVSYGKRAAEAYQNATLLVLPGEDHGFSPAGRTTAAKAVYDFLTKQIQKEVL